MGSSCKPHGAIASIAEVGVDDQYAAVVVVVVVTLVLLHPLAVEALPTPLRKMSMEAATGVRRVDVNDTFGEGTAYPRRVGKRCWELRRESKVEACIA